MIKIKKEINIWLIAYLLPSSIWVIIIYNLQDKFVNVLLIHVFLLISTIISFSFLRKYYWLVIKVWYYNFLIYTLSILISLLIIWKLWLFYSISATLQELTMLSIFKILSYWNLRFYIIYFMISIPFTLSHDIDWIYKIFILWLWSFVSLYYFNKWFNIFYIISLHIIFWSLLIKFWLIYN